MTTGGHHGTVDTGPGVGNGRRERIVDVVVVVLCDTDLVEVVTALSSASRFASSLNRRKQQ